MQLLEVGFPGVATSRGPPSSQGERLGRFGECCRGLPVGGGVRLQEGSLDALGAGAIPFTFGPEISFHLALA